MEPRDISAGQWDLIGRSILSLTAFVGLSLGGALALLVGCAVLPSIAADELEDPVRWLRRTLTVLGAIGLLVAVMALGLGLALTVDVLRSIFPRFLI